jgi:Fe-S cluster biogenesis protein NfuA
MTHEQQVTTIKQVLEHVRPAVMMDGGNIEFVKLENNIVYVRLEGACVGCPSVYYTLKMGIHEAIQAQLPDIEDVLPVE